MKPKSSERRGKATRRGRLVIDRNRCKGCTYCVDFCPTDVLAMSQETNAKGYYIPEVVKEDECTACGLCEAICPDFAIRVVLLDREEDEDKPIQP
jgi:2-oxoglutarate ferredoxin oxidoreductase subunit delta